MTTKVRTLKQIAKECYGADTELIQLSAAAHQAIATIQYNEIMAERNEIERERNLSIQLFLSQYIKS